MKSFSLLIGAAVLAFSSGAWSNNAQQTLLERQNACVQKQVTHACAIRSSTSASAGHCVDAQEYGLICLSENNQ